MYLIDGMNKEWEWGMYGPQRSAKETIPTSPIEIHTSHAHNPYSSQDSACISERSNTVVLNVMERPHNSSL
jgi:hypothetical protein